MLTVHKIKALIEVADSLADIEVVFENEREAEKAIEFLKNVEGLAKLVHAEVVLMSFEDFKEKLGESFDVIEENASLRGMDTANTVAA